MADKEQNHECTCNPLVPEICVIDEIIEETPDIKTFRVRTKDGKKPFELKPGQLAMFSMVNVGEGMFSITAQGEDYLDFAIKAVGQLTDALHNVTPGQEIGLRGPYGNNFPVDECKGHDLIFVGGGIGLAPVRSFIRYALEHREDYGKIDVVCGSRCPDDLCFKDDIFENWPKEKDTEVHITVDRCDEDDWACNIGFVPPYLKALDFKPDNRKVVLCGPPIMIKLGSEVLMEMGFKPEQIITTLEMRMKCGIGKCGRCNIGSKYICLDGPVFNLKELETLPDEY